MIIDHCQRFAHGREYRRPANERIDPRVLDVEPIASEDEARAFIREHHYLKTSSSAVHRFGIYVRGELAGVALFGPPSSTNAHRKCFPTLSQKEAVTLGRLVCTPLLLGDGESYFIARCFKLLASPKLYRPFYKDGKTPRRPIVAVESCADPHPRTNERGERCFKGHLGIVYQATNGQHVGTTNPSTLRLLPDGTTLSNRTQGKLVRAERGEDDAVTQLVAAGADPLDPDEDEHAWLKRWRAELTRGMRHRGNYRYLWCLDPRREREVLGRHPDLDYPKFTDERRRAA